MTNERVYVWVGFAKENGSLNDYVVSADLETAKSLTIHLLDYSPLDGEAEWSEKPDGRHELEVEAWADESAFIQKTPLMAPEALFEYE